MIDPAAPRPSKGWPLLAISLLVVLLAGFLFIKWSKREEAPLIVKEPPPVVHPVDTAAKPADPVVPVKPADPVPPTPAESAAKAGDAEFEQRVKELKEAIKEKKWEPASAALEAARKLRADAPELKGIEETIAAGRKQEEADRAEAARLAELRVRREREWAVVKEKVEKDRTNDLWDAALQSLDAIAKAFPDIDRDEEYKNALRQVKGFQAESDKLFKRDMAEAEKHFAAGRYGQALSAAGNALKYYPERKAQILEFQARAREIQSEKTMVRIPSTPCWIGSDDRSDEKPLRQVKLPPFLMDKYEVTNEDYYAFVTATGHEAPPIWQGRKPPKDRERHPVIFVAWDDADAYAKWAGKRLPTAEEWEVAARGPDKREFPWGNAFLEKEDKYSCNCLEYWQFNKNKAPGTTVVDDKDFDNGVSAFGVYGMGGNVWEWTATSAPAQGSKPPPEFRILKGGSFTTPQKAIRSSNVYAEDPRLGHPDVGFRCVRDVK
jgi:formylglycine-generating enzyme required for sulfatase activity